MSLEAEVRALDGASAPPRTNGELVFEEPWHARAFGLAVGLVQEQGRDWDEFRVRLIEEIDTWERTSPPGTPYSYYDCWATALERFVVAAGFVTPGELEDAVHEAMTLDHHEHDDH
jgi:nitrile hydratase accessory protein